MANERIWYPIEDSLRIGQYIIGLLDSSIEHVELFRKAKERPSSMNDALVNRTKKLFTERKEHIQLHEEQIIKWKEEAKSDFEKSEVIRLTQMIEELYKINQEVLDIADYISSRTIETILNMDEFELAIKVLTGELTLPDKKKD